MGHMGAWVEFKKERIRGKSKTLKLRPQSSNATFKRELQGLQTAGLYLNTNKMARTQYNKADFFSLKASQARLDRSRIGLRTPISSSTKFRASQNGSRPGSGLSTF